MYTCTYMYIHINLYSDVRSVHMAPGWSQKWGTHVYTLHLNTFWHAYTYISIYTYLQVLYIRIYIRIYRYCIYVCTYLQVLHIRIYTYLQVLYIRYIRIYKYYIYVSTGTIYTNYIYESTGTIYIYVSVDTIYMQVLSPHKAVVVGSLDHRRCGAHMYRPHIWKCIDIYIYIRICIYLYTNVLNIVCPLNDRRYEAHM